MAELASREAKSVFKSETQHYVICPYCKEIHIHHVDFGTQDRPANCDEGAERTYVIKNKYTLKEIAQAINSRDHMTIKKRKLRANARAEKSEVRA